MIGRHYTKLGAAPLDAIEWEDRPCKILDAQGLALFERSAIQAPKFWSQTASDIVTSKYLRVSPSTGQQETGIRALIERIVGTLSTWGRADGHLSNDQMAQSFSDELAYLLVHQHAAFNSPVWFNVGITPQPQCSACFIVSAGDSMESLLELQRIEGMLFKYGSGTGSNLSGIRSSKEALSSGGNAAGPVAFMRAFDAWAGVIKSGGTTRRAAKMQILNATHPDILDFIGCKAIEERKVSALIAAGFSGNFSLKGGAYDSAAFQNANLSVRVSDDFMRKVSEVRPEDQLYETVRVSDGKTCESLSARKVLRALAEAAHACGDPGLQFDDTINAWNTTPAAGRINASNPCSEYMHVDNSACNLASINLGKYVSKDLKVDISGLLHTIDLLILAQDIIVEHSSYPTSTIEQNARNLRQLGLGFTNLGGVLMRAGVAYDSEVARDFAAGVSALIGGRAYATSAALAHKLGPFKWYTQNRHAMIDVLRKHQAAASKLRPSALTDKLFLAAKDAWDSAEKRTLQYGSRNAQVTAIAPTGTIAFMMDCDTTGIEPDISLIKTKHLEGGGLLRMVNQAVRPGLAALGYSAEEQENIAGYLEAQKSLKDCPLLKPAHLEVFTCAYPESTGHAISSEGHLKMLSVVQPFVSGSISKTVNLPSEATVEDVESVFKRAWSLGLKSIAIYRRSSKQSEPLMAPEPDSTPNTSRCRVCGSAVVTQQGGCMICQNCGSQTGCS